MKHLLISGILAILTSCCIDPLTVEVPDTGNPDTCYRTFGPKTTKALCDYDIYFTWKTTQEICVYSLDADGKVLFKDICSPTNVSGGYKTKSTATLTAEVAKEAKYWFACYPASAVTAEVGDVIGTDPKAITYTMSAPSTGGGTLEQVSIMSCMKMSDGVKDPENNKSISLVFEPRNSMLFVGKTIVTGANIDLYDLKLTIRTSERSWNVTVPRSYGYSDSNPYFIPISTNDITVPIETWKTNGRWEGKFPNRKYVYDEVDIALIVEGYVGETIIYNAETVGIEKLLVGKYKQYVFSKIVQN